MTDVIVSQELGSEPKTFDKLIDMKLGRKFSCDFLNCLNELRFFWSSDHRVHGLSLLSIVSCVKFHQVLDIVARKTT